MFESVPTGVSVKTLKHITVDEQNYLKLKRLGNAGDSFNDVLSRVLKKLSTEESIEEKDEAEVR
jgi:predicted CopG family antitoxin